MREEPGLQGSQAGRRALVMAVLASPWAFARAQGAAQRPAQSPLSSVGVFSLLGDSVQVVTATDAPSDTRIERKIEDTVQFKNIGFDLLALRKAREALLQHSAGLPLGLYRAPTALSAEEQRAIGEQASQGALPAWMVQTLVAKQHSHALILTRTQGKADFQTGDGHAIGRGTVEGIGFYLDSLYSMRNSTTGAMSSGLIAPFVHMRLTLMDTQTAAVQAAYEVHKGVAFASTQTQVAADPWTFMSAAEKVNALRDLVEEGVARAMPVLLKPN